MIRLVKPMPSEFQLGVYLPWEALHRDGQWLVHSGAFTVAFADTEREASEMAREHNDAIAAALREFRRATAGLLLALSNMEAVTDDEEGLVSWALAALVDDPSDDVTVSDRVRLACAALGERLAC